jgi:hypothetical protein
MRPLVAILLSFVCALVFAKGTCAQDRLIPAGTLLQCTINEPNFSSATAAVGDPILCHLRTLEEFGRPAFPRGAMLGGHLEDEKDPGHFWGKGYLKITFDRVILPYGDLPVPAKVIQAKGFKVDKNGDIDGKGHAKRDVAEWMMPPLWPWKLISLPKRGPRPRLKGEEPLELRVMDDISIPGVLAYGPVKPDRPPYAGSAQPSSFSSRNETTSGSPAKKTTAGEAVGTSRSRGDAPQRVTVLVLKSSETYTVAKYRIDGGLLRFEDLNGTDGAVEASKVDWLKTAEMTRDASSLVTAGMSRLH